MNYEHNYDHIVFLNMFKNSALANLEKRPYFSFLTNHWSSHKRVYELWEICMALAIGCATCRRYLRPALVWKGYGSVHLLWIKMTCYFTWINHVMDESSFLMHQVLLCHCVMLLTNWSFDATLFSHISVIVYLQCPNPSIFIHLLFLCVFCTANIYINLMCCLLYTLLIRKIFSSWGGFEIHCLNIMSCFHLLLLKEKDGVCVCDLTQLILLCVGQFMCWRYTFVVGIVFLFFFYSVYI